MATYYSRSGDNFQGNDQYGQHDSPAYHPSRSDEAKPAPGSMKKKPKLDVLSTKVFVGYLPETFSKKEFVYLFEPYGTVVECDIVKDFAFVHFKTIREAKAAVDALDGTDFKGQKLNVQISISKVRPRPGMGDNSKCYRCGKSDHWTKHCPDNPNSRHNDDDHKDNRRDDPGHQKDDRRYDRRDDRKEDRRDDRSNDHRDNRRDNCRDDPYDRMSLPAAYRDPRDPYYNYYRDYYRYGYAADRYRPYTTPYARRAWPAATTQESYDPNDPYARPPPEFYKKARALSSNSYSRH